MNAVLAFTTFILQATLVTVFDFSETEAIDAWTVVNDGVMGGVSEGLWYQEDDYAVFEGEISLDNNGGFSSVRLGFRAVDLSGYDGFALTVRGDGQQYAFGIRDVASRYDHRLTFETTAVGAEADLDDPATWETIYIPFDDLTPTFFGRENLSAAPLETRGVRGLNLIISDEQVGAFRIEIASIALYSEDDSAAT
ncbi:MAG: CIA30 family protein [Chloroflexota bacterium]